MRVAFVLRSAEVQPLFWRFVWRQLSLILCILDMSSLPIHLPPPKKKNTHNTYTIPLFSPPPIVDTCQQNLPPNKQCLYISSHQTHNTPVFGAGKYMDIFVFIALSMSRQQLLLLLKKIFTTSPLERDITLYNNDMILCDSSIDMLGDILGLHYHYYYYYCNSVLMSSFLVLFHVRHEDIKYG